ncbi:MAG: hypothetical protein AB7V26_14170 [Lysobacterales bacterium]
MKPIALATLFWACTTGLCAEPLDAGQRQHRQVERIAAGVRSGALDARELRGLLIEQRSIARSRRVARADGVISPRERVWLRLRQDRASRHIYRQKHDRQWRPWRI